MEEKCTDNTLLQEDKPVLNLELDILTPESAIKCLRDEVNVLLPNLNVKPCNNLNEYFMKSTSNSKKNTPKQCEPFAVPLVRNFERILKKPPSGIQANIGFVERVKKKKQDVFSRAGIQNLLCDNCPILTKRLDEVVKVLIRRRRKVPYVSRVIEYKGTLVMFDKHMNLYMQNVVESFTYACDNNLMKRARFRENVFVRGDNIILIHM